jgi:3-oxoacyl-(acyl-carrier-protein) synthase
MSALVTPFANEASGTAIGEGGGILIVEASASCAARGGNPWCSIDGIGCRQSIADSPLEADPGALASAIRKALVEANCDVSAIDVIVPLGSGIKQLDDAEREGLSTVFGDRLSAIPTITTIPYTGNCMAGNGAIAISVAAKSIKEQRIPARLGAKETNGIDASRCETTKMPINNVLVISPSEGGQCVAIVLGRLQA